MKSHHLLTTIAAVLLVGCGPKAPDISIHEAASDGNIEAVKQHIAAGTDVNAKNGFGETPLLYAASEDSEEIVELLIANGADVNPNIRGGWNPLYSAALVGRKEIVELLIAKGADVNVKNKRDKIPLYAAARNGRKEIAELLIAKGAEVNAKMLDGRTLLDRAIRFEITDLLRKHGAKTKKELEAATNKAEKSIWEAVSTGNIEAVKQHLDKGVDLGAKDDVFDGTPLHFAAYGGKDEIAVLLISKGADVNAIGGGKVYPTKETPLDAAIRGKHPKTADLLRKHGGKTAEELKAEGK